MRAPWLLLLVGLLVATGGCFDATARRCSVTCTGNGPPCPGALLCDPAAGLCVGTLGECVAADAGVDRDVDGGRDAPERDADGSIAPPGPCVAGTLCALKDGFAALPAGWSTHVEGTCRANFVSEALVFDLTDTCAAGTNCWIETPRLPVGLARLTARAAGFQRRSGGEITLDLLREPGTWMELAFDNTGMVTARTKGGGTTLDLGSEPADDLATYSIRVTEDDVVVFEVWHPPVGPWQEIAHGEATVHEDDVAQFELGFYCRDTTAASFGAVWGEYGDQNPID